MKAKTFDLGNSVVYCKPQQTQGASRISRGRSCHTYRISPRGCKIANIFHILYNGAHLQVVSTIFSSATTTILLSAPRLGSNTMKLHPVLRMAMLCVPETSQLSHSHLWHRSLSSTSAAACSQNRICWLAFPHLPWNSRFNVRSILTFCALVSYRKKRLKHNVVIT